MLNKRAGVGSSEQVITDPLTSRSKGYGFVRFGSEPERDRALGDMSGHFISNRPIRCATACEIHTLLGDAVTFSGAACWRLLAICLGVIGSSEVAVFDRVSLATAKKSASLQTGPGSLGSSGGGGGGSMQGALGDLDPSNTTLFIGGLSPAVRARLCQQRAGTRGASLPTPPARIHYMTGPCGRETGSAAAAPAFK